MESSVLDRPVLLEEALPTESVTGTVDVAGYRWSGPIERWLTFALPFAGYLVLALLFAIRYHAYFGDAQSREANAFYVFFSNDPHLAAIGFVWNPLTSIAEMPLLVLHPLFPALTHEALAAGIMSAVFMAGTCFQLFRFFEDLELSQWAKWALLACFALNPMIIVYGGSGMSEALFNFTLALTTRYLALWLREGTTRSLVISGLWLGVAYAARNEVVAGAALGAVVVLAVTYRRTEGSTRHRRYAAVSDALIFSLPFVVSFVGWAGASWLIVGHPFEQLSSSYGTASQIKVQGNNSAAFSGGQFGSTGLGHLKYTALAMWSYAPLVPLILALAARQAWRHRNPVILAVLSILGGVCLFELGAFTTGKITWAYRYDLYMVLMSVMLAACAASTLGTRRSTTRRRGVVLAAGRRTWTPTSGLAAFVSVLLILPGLVTTERTMLYSNANLGDQLNYDWVLWPDAKRSRADQYRYQWQRIRDLDAEISALHLPNGSLMVDNFTDCIPMLIMMSPHPRQFAIPNDESYKGRLGAPYQDGVRYMLVSDPRGTFGSLDSLNVAYPSLYDTGDGIATLARNISLPICGDFKLYKLIPEKA